MRCHGKEHEARPINSEAEARNIACVICTFTALWIWLSRGL